MPVPAVFVIGTRAELIKCFPVMRELQRRGIEYRIIHTGQHSIEDMCEKFGVKEPSVTISPPPEKSSKFFGNVFGAVWWSLSFLLRLRSEIKKLKPSWVLYHGDTMSTALGAIASSRLLNPLKTYKNVHLEAGLRSGSIWEPFPEEISRRIADLFSGVRFAVSTETEQNLKHLWYRGKTVLAGNSIVDAAWEALGMSTERVPAHKQRYCLITVHRHENITSEERLRNIIEIIEAVPPIKKYMMLHDNTKRKLEEFGLYPRLEKTVEVLPLKSYENFIKWLKNAALLLTDGGSIQEESLIFKVPCIILRKHTERREGLKTGINYLSELDVGKTRKVMEKYLKMGAEKKRRRFKNPYGERGVSKKIVDYLEGSL